MLGKTYIIRKSQKQKTKKIIFLQKTLDFFLLFWYIKRVIFEGKRKQCHHVSKKQKKHQKALTLKVTFDILEIPHLLCGTMIFEN